MQEIELLLKFRVVRASAASLGEGSAICITCVILARYKLPKHQTWRGLQKWDYLR